MSTSAKACPRCGLTAPLNTPHCAQCGHQYRTQFAPPPLDDRTQVVSSPPPPPIVSNPTQIIGADMTAPFLERPGQASFKIMGADGQEHGPVPLHVLRQWAAEGRLTAQTPVLEVQTGQQFVAGEHPYLRGSIAAPILAPPPQYPVPPPYPSAVSYQAPVPYQQPMYSAMPPSSGENRVPMGTHSAGVAVLLSFLIVGGGQFYNRQGAKGGTMLIGGILLAVLTLALAGIGGSIVWIISMIDAGVVAGRLNRGETVAPWQFF